jgi:hypothetical protein
MLELTIPAGEQWDESRQMFVTTKETTLHLEHSLLSLSKWESKWCKPYLSNKGLTFEESVDYVRCMTIDKNVDPNVYSTLTPAMFKQINDYIAAPMSATYFKKPEGRGSSEKVVAELIYYWMISCEIPFECQKWHLNRLLALIQVCQRKNNPKKMNRGSLTKNNASLNAQRKARHHTHG